MTTIHHSPPPGAAPFAIYEDPDDLAPPSPSEVYDGEGDASFNSEISIPGVDEIIPSIENEPEPSDEPEPYKGSYTSRHSILSSRRASGMTSTSFISSLPSEISISSKPVAPANNVDSRYNPRKERPPFRNPASVRAMQMASPPPLPALEASRERVKGNYKLATPSRSGRSESVSTMGSRRSRPHRDSVHREHQAHQSPRATPTPQQQFPLVLLHVTIIPMQLPYAHDFMVQAMPDWLVENYRVLEEKLQDIVLMRRGLLIQHPRDEYDVLEERILESLELQIPRLLKCGHFVGPEEDAEEDNEDEESQSVADEEAGRGSRMSGGTITNNEEGGWKYPTPEADDASVCTDCHRQVKKPGKGIGVGFKRWDMKIYAANGLMRAGAWSAAWSEMERCDVEISPWIPEDTRKALDKRLEEELEAAKRKAAYAAELQRQLEEEAARQKQLEDEAEAKRREEEANLQRRIQAEAAALQRKLEEEAIEKRRLEESLIEKIEEAKETIRLEFEAQALAEASSVAERLRTMEEALKKEQEKVTVQVPPVLQVPPIHAFTRDQSRGRSRSSTHRSTSDEIPIGTLLKNYFLLLLRDSRNFFILVLGGLVIYLLTNMNTPWGLQLSAPDLPSGLPFEHLSNEVSSVVITSTATLTATSVATLTVTEPQPAESTHETASSLSSVIASIASTSESVNEMAPSDQASVGAASQSVIDESDSVEVASETTEQVPLSTSEGTVLSEQAGSVETQSESTKQEPLPTSESTLISEEAITSSELLSASPVPENSEEPVSVTATEDALPDAPTPTADAMETASNDNPATLDDADEAVDAVEASIEASAKDEL